MANKAEECRLRAEQCEQTAKAATNPTEQRIYAELARQWRQMARGAIERWLSWRQSSASSPNQITSWNRNTTQVRR